MSVRALSLAKKIVSKQINPNSAALRPGFVPAKSLSITFTDPKKAEFVNTFLMGMNQRERDLLEKRDLLIKQLGPSIPWSFYEEYIDDTAEVDSLKSIYDSIFVDENLEAIPRFKLFNKEEEERNAIEASEKLPDFTGAVERRAKHMIEEIERDINPLLNPFAEFWIYEKDGPEFAEVFAARPKWNEYINNRAEEYAFEFARGDPATNPDEVQAFTARVEADMDTFQTHGTSDEILKQVMSGDLAKSLENHYSASLELNEQHLLEHFTEDDTAALSFRSGYITPESDPLAKRFGGH